MRVPQCNLTGGFHGHVSSTVRIARRYLRSGSSGGKRFCPNISIEVVLGSLKRKINIWGGRRFSIVVVRLEEFLDLIYCVISGIEDICIRYRRSEELIGSSILNILIYFFHLEVHFLQV